MLACLGNVSGLFTSFLFISFPLANMPTFVGSPRVTLSTYKCFSLIMYYFPGLLLIVGLEYPLSLERYRSCPLLSSDSSLFTHVIPNFRFEQAFNSQEVLLNLA